MTTKDGFMFTWPLFVRLDVSWTLWGLGIAVFHKWAHHETPTIWESGLDVNVGPLTLTLGVAQPEDTDV